MGAPMGALAPRHPASAAPRVDPRRGSSLGVFLPSGSAETISAPRLHVKAVLRSCMNQPSGRTVPLQQDTSMGRC